MIKFFNSLINLFSSNSARNIDKNLAYYQREAKNYHLDTSHLQNLEVSIKNTEDPKLKHQLKVELKNLLESLVFSSPEGQSDRAW
ncbi:hypothetical protein [Chryseobacterium mulctrae]|uniref:hypothetical protein n=1 Tax=Chryseobacterium mulctrae TaxID=2576777 RepID=UPI00111754B6|nr:hypothetical protein [Chryseobacterium mulctrae]